MLCRVYYLSGLSRHSMGELAGALSVSRRACNLLLLVIMRCIGLDIYRQGGAPKFRCPLAECGVDGICHSEGILLSELSNAPFTWRVFSVGAAALK